MFKQTRHGLSLALFIALLAGCAAKPVRPTSSRLSEGYRRAVEIARGPAPLPPYRPLTPLERDHRVLLASFTGWAGFKPLLGKTTRIEREMWVTVVPELARRCQAFDQDPEALALRLDELLGMPPTKPYTTIVEVLADPKDVFRPCPDPRTDTTQCGIDFPADAPPEHRSWFDRQLHSSYGPGGYPWTRRGYTYDWKEGAAEHFGLSEYVIRKNSQVEIRRVQTIQDYCRPQSFQP